MKLAIYQVDAFAERVFEGNPAAVCPLGTWLSDELLQKIAAENNLSETAFFVKEGEYFHLRWFTPTEEIDLCGHATLATAHVIFNHLAYQLPQITFHTRSGLLHVKKLENGLLSMDFPASMPAPIEITELLVNALGIKPKAVSAAFDYIVELENQTQIEGLTPDLLKLSSLGLRGVVFTARGNDVDFVSRCFFPNIGINEDPVTGSAHCELMPYWANKLGKNELIAKQLSKRSGVVYCTLSCDRVELAGKAADYLRGEIYY